MDLMKLFALLIAVASVHISAEGSKKKIRIHLPQRVKHIHHHKKIYITNHHASEASQYAPTFLPNADSAVAVPSNIALQSVSNVLPLNSVDLIDNHQHRIPGLSPAASKLLPLYRARGYYGPTPSEWDEQEYDIAAPSELGDNPYPPAPHVSPTSAPQVPSPKRVKIVKVNEKKPKKGPQRLKAKRVPVRTRPPAEEEHPVSKFHEHFYSDLDGSGTIKKVKKPQRVEKIVDGDTEHIHTYSEEHIHKLVFDDGSKLSNIVGVDPVGSMSAITAGHPLMPFKNSLLAIPSGTYSAFTVGSLGTPSHLEYTAYNPRDVTHDHIFHDHGEIPPDVDLNREPLGYPPKVSYNSQGLAISDGAKGHKAKNSQKYLRPTKPSIANELSYYESLYTNNRIKKQPNAAAAVSQFDTSLDSGPEQDFRAVPSFNSLAKNSNKIRSTYYNGPIQEFRQKHGTNLAPYSVSSTIVHDYQPKPTYPGALPPSGFSKFKDNVANFHSNNYDYDAYASSSNILFSEDKNDNTAIPHQSYKGKKKSVSTQNISFGGQDHQTMVDHFGASSVASESIHEDPSAFEDVNSYDNGKTSESISPTPYTIKETSPAHLYYTSMAIKALYNEPASMPEASNDNLQYAEPPSPEATTPYTPSAMDATTEEPSVYFEILPSKSSEKSEVASNYTPDSEQRSRAKHRKSTQSRDPKQRYSVIQNLRSVKEMENEKSSALARKFLSKNRQYLLESALDSDARGKLKYGDKI
ncbi:uncharacterized protein LOC128683256 [Plodia interpunctella]|uniref:uncharacterized protein LOC128683256 n=1 Tax=Plodia interpunctella TaxID=58824 RepID=UPI0023674E0D|nr:uncharacterized protein LOC128683256 [Plodia interpunctella]